MLQDATTQAASRGGHGERRMPRRFNGGSLPEGWRRVLIRHLGRIIGSARVVDLSHAGICLDVAGDDSCIPVRKGCYCEIVWEGGQTMHPAGGEPQIGMVPENAPATTEGGGLVMSAIAVHGGSGKARLGMYFYKPLERIRFYRILERTCDEEGSFA